MLATLPPQGSTLRAEKLLINIYSHIKEADSIYAVTRSHHSSDLLPLLEHEGAWSRALLGYDLQQQAGEGNKSHAGVVNALQQLGCQSTLQIYLKGITSASMPQGGNLDPSPGRKSICFYIFRFCSSEARGAHFLCLSS